MSKLKTFLKAYEWSNISENEQLRKIYAKKINFHKKNNILSPGKLR